jgi:hypothetical protein
LIEGESSDYSGNAPESALMAMRAEAGRRGCDVLLVTGANNFARGRDLWSSSGAGYHGACLAYTDKPPAPAPAPARVRLQHGLLFRSAQGNVYRVAPESRDEALRAGWVEIGSD